MKEESYPENNSSEESPKKRRPLWRRVVKWVGITAVSLFGLFVLVCALMVWILTPDRLTPLVEEQASKYLDADVKVARVELTFWKTFPRMHVDVDSLRIISRSLKSLTPEERAALPADADSLLYIKQFHGGINVLQLLAGNIRLHDVTFDSPRVNLLQVNDSVANYQIVPPSEEADTSSTKIPSIRINRFEILNAQTIRFRSMVDSMDVTARLENVSMTENRKLGEGLPKYHFQLSGGAKLPFLADYDLSDITFGMDGQVDWDSDQPYVLAVKDMKVSLDEYNMALDAACDFSEDPLITQFSGRINDLPVASAMRHFPPTFKKYVEPLKTDMLLSATMELTKPWALADTILPSCRATLTVPACRAEYQNLKLSELSANLEVDFDGGAIDRSVFNLKNLRVVGEGMAADFSGSATNVIIDPMIKGHFKGSVDLSKIPPRLASEIPVTLAGTIDGDAAFCLNLSDLNEENFHKMEASGELSLHKITAQMPGLMNVMLNHGEIRFGTTDSFLRDGHKVDSLLQVSMKIDTLAASGMGMNLEIKNFKAGAGTVNRASSADTTEINPFGGSIAFERLKFDSPEDSMHLRLRDTSVGGAFRRYKGNAHKALIDLRLASKRMMFGQALNRVSLTGTDLAITIHPSAQSGKGNHNRSGKANRDSLRSKQIQPSGDVDLRVDREDRKLLRKWDYSGTLKATKGRLVTPYFPLRNSLKNIDLTFNSDSIQLRNLLYNAGQSDFLINGSITNVRRALTSRRDNTLGVSFDVRCDTVNVNEIVKAVFAGPAIAANTEDSALWGGDDDTASANRIESMADTASTGPLLLPRNIDAQLRMRANHVLYSDLELSKFKGNILLYDGALNLRNLSASTEMGSIKVNGLYTGASPDSLQFGLGMKVEKFRLDRLTSIVPAIDSLLPSIKDFSGIVNADIAVTTDLERNMDIDIPSLRAAIKIEGDSLVLLDPDTFKTVSKWLLFKDKKKNMIDHMSVEVVIENSQIELYPFMFEIDRYRLGVMGHNDLAMNLNYHVSVLKSPVPFKFGINVKGTADKPKIRLGGAKFKENMVGERQEIADNTRVNLVQQIDNVFRRGVRNARLGRLNFTGKSGKTLNREQLNEMNRELDRDEKLTFEDSLQMIRGGLIENPDTLRFRP